MTEDEAKKKWCPFARVAAGTLSADGRASINPAAAVLNRIDLTPDRPTIPDATACIGSACMAWRWAVPVGAEYTDNEGLTVTSKGMGFCGLAGAPRP